MDSFSIEQVRDQELDEARDIQNSMMPSEALESGAMVVAHEFHPVAEVGGDFLDYFTLLDQTVGLYLGDVTGKGLPAALYAALTVGTLRGVNKTGMVPDKVLSLVNQRLPTRRTRRRYAAVQYAVFDTKGRRMAVSGAGMRGPLHLSARGCYELWLPGLPPGIFPNAQYETESVDLTPGDSIIFFSDGLTDAMDCQGEHFGVERLLETCSGHHREPPPQILSHIFSAIEEFGGAQPQDDMAAAVVHILR